MSKSTPYFTIGKALKRLKRFPKYRRRIFVWDGSSYLRTFTNTKTTIADLEFFIAEDESSVNDTFAIDTGDDHLNPIDEIIPVSTWYGEPVIALMVNLCCELSK